MEISITLQLPLPTARPVTTAPAPAEPEETDRTDRTERARACRCDHERQRPRRGRHHVQRAARHLLRDIRHDIRDELKELRAAGDEEKIAAVKGAYHDFRDEVRNVLQGAGRGHGFDREAVVEGLGAAMAAFTAALREINGTAEEPPPAPDEKPTPDEALPPGALLDIGA